MHESETALLLGFTLHTNLVDTYMYLKVLTLYGQGKRVCYL
jgi:hypothetical protein